VSPAARESPALRLGISSCLLGQAVRWDGGHKRDSLLESLLGPHFQWVAVCPELEAGMGVPREAVRLQGKRPGTARLVGVSSARDWTQAMLDYARRRLAELEALDLCGFVLKSDSPSCGMTRVRLYARSGAPSRRGVGLFARALMRRMPLLPVEEEARLRDPVLRENFVERVFAFRGVKHLLASGCSPRDWIAFHAAHKYLLLSHHPHGYRALGRMVAQSGLVPARRRGAAYAQAFMEVLKHPATVRRHFNVLQHIAGYLKRSLSPEDKRELAAVLEDYRRGRVPRIVPLTLLRHHLARHRVEALAGQVYLSPHPQEMMLRNQV
jgi:uncharacterized protein YbgA (DUF1722 family)/uncharacterized protein YbbK (DUF523 family)